MSTGGRSWEIRVVVKENVEGRESKLWEVIWKSTANEGNCDKNLSPAFSIDESF